METERKIFANTFVLTTGHGAAQLLNFLFVIYFARAFGVEALGAYSFAISAATIASVFVSFGSNSLALREIARDPREETRLVGSLVPIQLCTGFLVFGVVTIVGKSFDLGGIAYGMLLLMALSHVVMRWSGLIGARFGAREQMAYLSGAEALRNLVRLLLGIAFISLFNDPVVAVGAFPIASLLVYLWLYFASTRSFGAPQFSLSRLRAVALAVAAWPYFSILVLGVLYDRLGIIFLRAIQSESAVGYFASAERLIVPVGLLYTMFLSSVFPVLSRLTAQDEQAMDTLVARCLRLLIVLTLPVGVLLYLFSADIIAILFGQEFGESAGVLRVAAWVFVIEGINGYFEVVAMATGNAAIIARVRFAALSIFVVVAIYLVNTMSYMGLISAIAIAEASIGIALYAVLRTKVRSLRILRAGWRTAVASLVVLVAGLILRDQPLVLRLVTLTMIVIASMLAIGVVKRHDMRFLAAIAFPGRHSGS